MMAATTAAHQMPQTLGISIIIDQDQEQVVYKEAQQQQQQQQKQHEQQQHYQHHNGNAAKQEQQLAAIKIYQKNQQQHTEKPQKEQQQEEEQQQTQEEPQQMSTLLINSAKRAATVNLSGTKAEQQQEETRETAAVEQAKTTASLAEKLKPQQQQHHQQFNSFSNTAAKSTPTTTLIDIKCRHNHDRNNNNDDNEESVMKKSGGEFWQAHNDEQQQQQQQQQVVKANQTGNTGITAAAAKTAAKRTTTPQPEPQQQQLLLQIAANTTTTTASTSQNTNTKTTAASQNTHTKPKALNVLAESGESPAAITIQTRNNGVFRNENGTKTTTIIKCYEELKQAQNAQEQEREREREQVGEEEKAAARAAAEEEKEALVKEESQRYFISMGDVDVVVVQQSIAKTTPTTTLANAVALGGEKLNDGQCKANAAIERNNEVNNDVNNDAHHDVGKSLMREISTAAAAALNGIEQEGERRSALENGNSSSRNSSGEVKVAKELVSLRATPQPQAQAAAAQRFSASATTTVNGRHLATTNAHVVTIKIQQQNSEQELLQKQQQLVPSDQETQENKQNSYKINNNNSNNSQRQVTVVTLNDDSVNFSDPRQSENFDTDNEFLHSNVENIPKININLFESSKMVQKTMQTLSTAGTTSQHQSNGSSVTDLNMTSHQSPYHSLYYMMSSGQFSPCETLDSGTGSDLESNNGNGSSGTANSTSPITTITHSNGVAKLEMHLKTTKIRVNGGSGNGNVTGLAKGSKLSEHLRASSLTDSEESETSSSVSCDSLHSNTDGGFTRQSSLSPIHNHHENENNNNTNGNGGQVASSAVQSSRKVLASFLPDSLLRDIRDRKYASNDQLDCQQRQSLDSVSENGDHYGEVIAHAKPFYNETTTTTSPTLSKVNPPAHDKRSSLIPTKTFILNHEDGTFIDTKLNSMPRKYEADQYYNFHVNEHANFRSFGQSLHEHDDDEEARSHNGGDDDNGDDCHESLGEYPHHRDHHDQHNYERHSRSLRDDDFAGYKDIRSVSNTSTIRSSKGTVRGVKNRVRNGIATFLQLQQPNIKNYKEKDVGKVVLYTTSMGIIRDTYAKCANMKQILRTLLVKFEERDVFMSVEYQQEIKERMQSHVIRVPQLFVEGQHIGDADTVERLNESGELRQLLKPYKSIATAYTCQTCGGYRLLPCPSCNGSKKSVHRNHFTAEFVALKCMNCDEVGLVKCHNC